MACGIAGMLVRTGRYVPGAGAAIAPPPSAVADDLAGAVEWYWQTCPIDRVAGSPEEAGLQTGDSIMRHILANATFASLMLAAGMFPASVMADEAGQAVSTGDAAHAGHSAAFEFRGNAIVHVASGMEFPREVGGASFVSEKAFDDSGDYVRIRYKLPLSDGAVARVQIGMVELPGMTAREHYLSRRPIVQARLSHATPLLEAPLPELDFDNFCGRFSDGRKVEGLITAQFGNWGVRAETEYPATHADEAHRTIEAFLLALNWRHLQDKVAATNP